jgi:hypothetical protein
MADIEARTGRPLTVGERNLARTIFGDAIDYDPVRIRRRKWFPLQPRETVMAPCGHIHFHPESSLWSDDFASERLSLQALFMHEMTHVWQAQKRGKYYLPLMRHPFCRYSYEHIPGQRFACYGLEQQAEIVRHVFLMRNGYRVGGLTALAELENILPFRA